MTVEQLYAAIDAGNYQPPAGLYEESRFRYREERSACAERFSRDARTALGYERATNDQWSEMFAYAEEHGHALGWGEVLGVLLDLDRIVCRFRESDD